MREGYQLKDLRRVVEISPSRLQVWLENGWVQPSIQVASGYGTRNIYSRGDLYLVALFRQVVDMGLQRQRAGDFLARLGDKRIRYGLTEPRHDRVLTKRWAYYLYAGEDSYAGYADDLPRHPITKAGRYVDIIEIEDVETVLAVNVAVIRERIDRRMAELGYDERPPTDTTQEAKTDSEDSAG